MECTHFPKHSGKAEVWHETDGKMVGCRPPSPSHTAMTPVGSASTSVPPNLDGWELPEVRVSHVKQVAIGGGAPLERRNVIPGGSTGSHQTVVLGHSVRSDLRRGHNKIIA